MSVDVDWEYEDITLERVCFPEFRTSAPRTHAPPENCYHEHPPRA